MYDAKPLTELFPLAPNEIEPLSAMIFIALVFYFGIVGAVIDWRKWRQGQRTKPEAR